MKKTYYLGRHASILYRQANRFYDRELAPYCIGCGQQFFLLRIFEHQGINVLDLARLGQFDKGTATRAVQKLEEEGYIRSERTRRTGGCGGSTLRRRRNPSCRKCLPPGSGGMGS